MDFSPRNTHCCPLRANKQLDECTGYDTCPLQECAPLLAAKKHAVELNAKKKKERQEQTVAKTKQKETKRELIENCKVGPSWEEFKKASGIDLAQNGKKVGPGK